MLETMRRTSGLTLPPLKADPQKVVDMAKTALTDACVVFTPELEKFFRDLVDKNVSAPTIKQAVGYLTYYGPQQQLGSPRRSHLVPGPAR